MSPKGLTKPRKLSLRSRWRIRWHNWRIKFAPSTRKQLRVELAQHLHDGLGALQKRLCKRYIPELCALTIAQETNIRSLADEDAQQRLASLAGLLVHAIDRLLLERQQRRARFNSLSRQCALVFDQRAYYALIDKYLQEEATSLMGYLADRRALSRRLDLDALRERCDEHCHRSRVMIELASRGVAWLWAKAMQADGPSILEGRARALQSQPQRELLRVFFTIDDGLAQIQIAQDIASLLSAQIFAPLDKLVLDRLFQIVDDEDHHPWLRRNVLRVLYLNDPDQAIETCARLLNPSQSGAPDAFVLRTLIVQDLARLSDHHPQALSLLRAQWVGAEPSEHVRICLAQCMRDLAADPLDIVSWLARRVCLHRSAQPVEQSPKVRAMAMDTVSCMLASTISDSDASEYELLQYCAEAVDSCLQDEEDHWVCIQCCRQIQRILLRMLGSSDVSHFRSALRAWSHTLSFRLSDPASSPGLANEAGATLDLIAIALDQNARQAYAELSQEIALIGPGRKKNLRKTPAMAALTRDQIGQILSWMSRKDWGLYVQSTSKSLRVQRGDRYRVRLWRILHELWHPSPNKRKGFVHSTGRVFRGDLRAHPFGLDEATATVVPGERVSLGQGLGWGRHLPSVDDLSQLPWRPKPPPIELHHSYGKTLVRFQPGYWANWTRWIKLTWNYTKLARLRQASLQANDPKGRSAFASKLQDQYQIHLELHPRPRPFDLDSEHCPQAQREHLGLIRSESRNEINPSVNPGLSYAIAPFAWVGFDPLNWLQSHAHYFFSKQGNDQNSLSLFLTGALGLFLFQGYWRRRGIRVARDKIPLSIGGWGTRGKSGTERLKAALFHGLGYRVFSKTTGCEAMLIHSMAQGPQSEIFVFRPYGKATIWEQANLLKLASKLNADVFLWECMALNPTYVSILQHGWMNDDLATITNAYPDHEDIQGPAGHNVAKVISTFIPKRSIAVSSEVNFHPLMRDRAKAQTCEYDWVKPDQEAWIGDDFLALFPYQEHPRNIALVAQMGDRLGVELDRSVYNMATQVVPDLGVLKTYGDVRIKGRVARFINGCSANERAGFLNNWKRTGCDRMDPNKQPLRMLATVVNNRADRVSRSEVFARILVNDAAADKHILIGTNLSGLIGYLQQSIREHLKANPLFATGQKPECQSTLDRFERSVARFRCPHPDASAWVERLAQYGQAAGCALAGRARGSLQRSIEAFFANPTELPASLSQLQAYLQSNQDLADAVQSAWIPDAHEIDTDIAECLTPPQAGEIYPLWCELLAKALCVHQLRVELHRILEHQNPSELENFERRFQSRFKELFEASLHPILDPDIKGDQIIVRCVELFPPGVELTLLGCQNIKGTGLDLVYRWVALGQVQQDLAKAQSQNPQTRAQALRSLESFGDHGLIDLGLIRHTLPKLRARSDSEAAAITRLVTKVQERYAQTLRGIDATGPKKRGGLTLFLNWIEGWIEFLDGARRYHQSKSLSEDLVHGRVSHARATLEMREICGRSKGGWLAKWWNSFEEDQGYPPD